MDFLWEKEAANGQPMPDGLPEYEQWGYQAIAALYERYYAGKISKENAGIEKRRIKLQLRLAYESDNFRDNLCFYHEKLNRMTEIAKTLCRKDPTPENAIKLCDVLDGLDQSDTLRPVLAAEHGCKCPVCGKFFSEEHAAKSPNYCESCGTRLGWKP